MMLTQPISSFLTSSARARRTGALDVGIGISTAIWRNQTDHMVYSAPKGHTFSYYTYDGTGTRRIDGGSVRGWPGAACILPEGQTSEWDITTPFEFLHLYVNNDELGRAYAETFDKDARLMALNDLTYFKTANLSHAFRQLYAATLSTNTIAAQEAVSEVIHAVFTTKECLNQNAPKLIGGLALYKRRIVQEFIDANLDRQITLRELAALVDLSDFHFQRSFRASSGVSPHTWIAHQRIARAKEMIALKQPFAQVADACGFSSQSHMSRSFTKATGLAPGKYRAHIA